MGGINVDNCLLMINDILVVRKCLAVDGDFRLTGATTKFALALFIRWRGYTKGAAKRDLQHRRVPTLVTALQVVSFVVYFVSRLSNVQYCGLVTNRAGKEAGVIAAPTVRADTPPAAAVGRRCKPDTYRCFP